MTDNSRSGSILRVATLSPHRVETFELTPDQTECRAIAQALGLRGLRKVSFRGRVQAEGRDGWRLEAQLGATVTQPCVVTLEPVTTRIDQGVVRHFVADWHEPDPDTEIEMPRDETEDPLGDTIDLAAVMTEALALSLPDYPRAEDAELDRDAAAPPGAEPLHEAETHPLAELAALKARLEGSSDDEDR